jgi:hypothetical protein
MLWEEKAPDSLQMLVSPGGQQIAFVGSRSYKQHVQLYDLATGKRLHEWLSPQDGINAALWSRDGRQFATGGRESLIYLWDATGGAKPTTNLDADWQRLCEPAGHDAAWRLALTPGVESLLARKLRPTPSLDARLWANLLDDLDSEDFALRQAAQKRLDALGERAIAAARRTLAGDTRLEIRRRLERFLRGQPLTPEGLRQHRAVFVLEQRKATALLYRLTEGDPDADLTREAKAALARLRAAGESPGGSTRRPRPNGGG